LTLVGSTNKSALAEERLALRLCHAHHLGSVVEATILRKAALGGSVGFRFRANCAHQVLKIDPLPQAGKDALIAKFKCVELVEKLLYGFFRKHPDK
jgi:hypothetical protein